MGTKEFYLEWEFTWIGIFNNLLIDFMTPQNQIWNFSFSIKQETFFLQINTISLKITRIIYMHTRTITCLQIKKLTTIINNLFTISSTFIFFSDVSVTHERTIFCLIKISDKRNIEQIFSLQILSFLPSLSLTIINKKSRKFLKRKV